MLSQTTFYAANKEQVLARAHEFVSCECGERIKRAGLGSHRKHSPRHRIWVQMNVSLELSQQGRQSLVSVHGS